ncbi:MAG TPA: PAS domain S-box protein [Gemmatimonadales bacterium]|nr:PAS domain S-box protein [Gemmatimonadales bacterium]
MGGFYVVEKPFLQGFFGTDPHRSIRLSLFGRTTPTASEATLGLSRLAAIVESSDDAIISKGLDGTVLSWNPAAERIFGYTREEMVGSSIYKLIPPDLHHEEQHILSRISSGHHVPHFETTRRHKNGTLFPVAVSVSPVRDIDGTIVGAASIKRDMSQIRRGQEVSAHLAAIVESSDDAILSKTLEGTVKTWNAAAERMYGFTSAEMIGNSIYQVVPQHLQPEEQQILERVRQGEHVAHYETVRQRKDGRQIDVSITLSPIRDQNGTITGASSIQRDITQRKRTEEALRQAAKMEAIGALAGGLAHDFNNQLYAVSGFAHFISRDPGLSPATRQDILELQKVAERMASLTRQLLAFARQQVLTPETLDLNAAVEDTRPMLQRLIGSNMQIELALAPGPKWVRVDRAQLVQVLLNLVINARDAMPKGGTILLRTTTLEIGRHHLVDRSNTPIDAGAYAELAVIDSGEGIGPEHIPHIFEPFYTTKEVGMGTGLGLATVEGIIAQSDGHIQVTSEVGLGTTIRLLLPLTPEPKVQRDSQSPVPRGAASRERILVVEDEDSVRTIVSRTLQADGYEVMGAREGKEALALLDEVGGVVDLIITDIVMPGMSGVQLAQELRQRYPDIPLMWMSGHPRETELNSDDVIEEQVFLHKPIAPEVLLRVVAEVLDGAPKDRA